MIRWRTDAPPTTQGSVPAAQTRLEVPARREPNRSTQGVAVMEAPAPSAETVTGQGSTTIAPPARMTEGPAEAETSDDHPVASAAADDAPLRSALRTSSMREVLVTLERCQLGTRTLRCHFNITNQSAAEKKFILGIGGSNTRFEEEGGGAMVFDDIGNDYMSLGGAVANHSIPNCDQTWSPCEIVKILTPDVPTAGWLRFDSLDPRAKTIKLLRLKWSDGRTWTPMDFRNIAIEKSDE